MLQADESRVMRSDRENKESTILFYQERNHSFPQGLVANVSFRDAVYYARPDEIGRAGWTPSILMLGVM
jgi:hypothetical protein